jgi:uncharacterized membrane protein YdjX (TVP38/TMEM64 family)
MTVDLPGQRAAVWRRAGILAVLCGLLAAAAASDTLHAALIDVLSVLQETIRHHPYLGMICFVAFAAVSAMFAFVSVAVVVPAAVFTWGQPLSMALLWLGWIAGGVLSYCIGRFLGRAVVHWLTAGALLRRLERRVQQDSPFGLILLFQLALPSEIPGYLLGLVRYRFLKYLLALGIAELPYTLATVYLGASFVERRSGVLLGMGAALILFSVGTFYVLRKRLK